MAGKAWRGMARQGKARRGRQARPGMARRVSAGHGRQNNQQPKGNEVENLALETIQVIVRKHGKVTPQMLVEEARSETSLIHDRFEWDDAVAGEKFRHEQARAIIRSVKIEGPDKGIVPAFVAVVVENENCYMPIDDAYASPDLWMQVTGEAIGLITGAKHRLKSLLSIEKGEKEDNLQVTLELLDQSIEKLEN